MKRSIFFFGTMKNSKVKISAALVIIIVLFSTWYLFLKKWDYKIIFTVPVHSTLAYSFINAHYEWNGKTVKPEKITFLEAEPWTHLHTELDVNDTIYSLDWHLDAKNDSLTKISVGVSDKERNLMNRVKILLSNTQFEKSARRNMIIIRNKIIERNQEFRYEFAGLDSIPEIPCVYITSKRTVRSKADEMIRNVILINTFVKEHQLVLNGDPMVLVKNWNPKSDTIEFDFCFPILHPELVPSHPEIKMKTISCPRAFKANFYGNYSYSDYSWYRLFEEARKNDETISGQIIEIFHNDPHSGGNDLNWKAGTYLGLKN